jgi:hypothetical protein
MPQDYKDYVVANGGIEGQVQPTVNSSPGVLSSAAAVTAQLTTVSNPFPGINQAITNGVVAVTPFTYSSPGGKAGAL